MRKAKEWKELHCFVTWEIWCHMNKIIFDVGKLSILQVVNISNVTFRDFYHTNIKVP